MIDLRVREAVGRMRYATHQRLGDLSGVQVDESWLRQAIGTEGVTDKKIQSEIDETSDQLRESDSLLGRLFRQLNYFPGRRSVKRFRRNRT